jgi:CMP-N-acetylneuraminic acid synthetase
VTEKPLPTDPDLLGSMAAIRRAAQRALEIAITTNTPCYVMQDGEIVDIAREHRLRMAEKDAGNT